MCSFVSDVSRSEFDALATRVFEFEQRQDAHAGVVAAAIQRLDGRLGQVDQRLGRLGIDDDS
jgi:hypothetical protein